MEHNFIIENDILLLRPTKSEDIEKIRIWRNKPNIRKCFITQTIISREQQLQWYSNYLKKENDYSFVIVEKISSNPIGTVSLYNIKPETGKGEFGRVFIGKETARGKGYGVSVCKLLVDFAFKQLNLRTVYLEVFASNIAAIHIYGKCGFSFIEQYSKNNILIYKMLINKS